MMQNKKIIGITGGSGSGKTHISALLRKDGFAVIDADETAHRCLEKPECSAEIAAEFGANVLKNGVPDRRRLGEIVFSDPEKLERLNKITHKYILADIRNEIEHASGDTVFVDGAALIESGMECDLMVGVLADKSVRKRRIMARDALSEADAERRISAQKSDGFYRKNCDFVIENNKGEPDISEIVKRVEK